MKKTRYDELKDKFEERKHRLEFIEDFKHTTNKYQFLVDHPSIFGTTGIASVFNGQTYPNIYFDGNTYVAHVSIPQTGAYYYFTATSSLLTVPYIVTVGIINNTSTPAVPGGFCITTLHADGGVATNDGAGWQDTLAILTGTGNVTQDITKNNVGSGNVQIGSTNLPTNVYITIKEYIAGTVQYIFTDINGSAVAGWTSTFTSFPSIWTTPATAQRYIGIWGASNSTTAFFQNASIVATPTNLL